jgi:signal transduction histidine kinase/ligand-binding sensor domain-containing protein
LNFTFYILLNLQRFDQLLLMNIKIQTSSFKRFLLCFLLCWNVGLYAQKYNFQHYDLTSGISQSQVLTICQDKANQIWFTTLGGVNCFDGKQFTSYTIDDGLSSNSGFAITCDNNGNIWTGGPKGISSFSNRGVINYGFKDKTIVRSISKIVCDKNNGIWAMAGRKVYKLLNNQLTRQKIIAADELITDIELDAEKSVYASVYNSGIYKFGNAAWQCFIPLTTEAVNVFKFDRKSPGTVIFITSYELFKADIRHVEKIKIKPDNANANQYIMLLQDDKDGLWIGTNKGVILVKNNVAQFFNERNGFTNERVFAVFEDAEKRMWFGTHGEGLYYFTNDGFLTIDKSQGLKNDIVMNLAKNAGGDIFMATNGNGLLSYSNKIIKQVQLPIPMSSTVRVTSVFNDNSNNLWVGTDSHGLWKKNQSAANGKFKQIGKITYPLNHITEDDSHTIWLTTGYGCIYIEHDKPQMVPSFMRYCSSIINIGADSMLVGTLNGVYLIKNKQLVTHFKLSPLAERSIMCLKQHGSFIFIGTNDNGLYVWNKVNGAVQNISTKQGLYSNMVYNIDIVKDQLWIGTGRGINKFILNSGGGRVNLKPARIAHLVNESNQNAILHTDSSVWIGTTSGINIYSINTARTAVSVPNTIIQNVSSFGGSKNKTVSYTYKNGYKLPVTLSLPSNQSHLSIKFQAVQFGNEKDVYYQYQLDGLDKNYSRPILSDVIDYPSLPPGKYTFKVRAINELGQFNAPATFSFVITPIFTETVNFKIFLIVSLLLAAYGIYRYKQYQNQQKQRYIEALKLHEQEVVRRQTAEDFHDDLGNKLTRINMLSELLDKKIDAGKQDEKFLIQQIKSSATEMYAGTKNILWALNPDNDNLQEVCTLIEKFGLELFTNTDTSFRMLNGHAENIKVRLPLGFSRNIILIYKELLHNVLKHAEATIVTLSVETTSDRYICFTLTDDGKGFESDKILEGTGIRNMQNRAKKLNGKLTINSKIGFGTTSQLIMPIP